MNRGRTVFAQLVDYFPKRDFRRLVDKYGGDHRVRSFSCWDQFLCMVFAQLTYRESLRDIEATLRAVGVKLYHLGIRGNVSRSTLADANDTRDSRIYSEFAELLITKARKLYSEDKFSVELNNVAYCLDASVVDLCLTLCPWAQFGNNGRAGIKLHTLLDLRGNIPTIVAVTPQKTYELTVFDTLPLEAGAFYIMDRGYFDWARLYRIAESQAFFVIRAKKDLSFQRLYSRLVVPESGVLSDHIGVPPNAKGQRRKTMANLKYPQQLRRIRYYDLENKRQLTFLTNNLKISARSIADLYKARWQVELLFKWVKQHLRIKAFYGTSENAIKSQIYIAISTYVLIATVKKELRLPQELYSVLQVLSVVGLEKMPISSAFSSTFYSETSSTSQISLNLLQY
jgi:hypothetical protein